MDSIPLLSSWSRWVHFIRSLFCVLAMRCVGSRPPVGPSLHSVHWKAESSDGRQGGPSQALFRIRFLRVWYLWTADSLTMDCLLECFVVLNCELILREALSLGLLSILIGGCVLPVYWVPSAVSKLLVTLWTVALQAPLSMGFSRQEYWSGLPCPDPGYFPNPGVEPESLTSPPLAGGFFTTSTTWEPVWFQSDLLCFFQASWWHHCLGPFLLF